MENKLTYHYYMRMENGKFLVFRRKAWPNPEQESSLFTVFDTLKEAKNFTFKMDFDYRMLF